jgi:opacity protein-like surface antigen
LRHSLQAFVLCVGLAAALSLPLKSAAGGIPAGPVIGTGYNSANASSLLAGAHAGYQWQNGSAVYGFETDLSAMHLHSSMNGTLTFPPPFSPEGVTSTNASINWYGTLRGRLGVTTGPLLFYGTGGLAYGHVGLNSSVGLEGSLLNSSLSSTRAGWVGGVGMDYMYRRDLIFSLSYQYVDLGTLNLASAMATPVLLGQSASAHAQFQTVMAGFSFRFAPTGASGPWQGGYVGGHVGGAWGLPTDASYSGVLVPTSDIRLKRDVRLLGRRHDGLGIYRYKYLWSDTVYVGVMAQEVALIHPDAVVRDPLSDYLRVDYRRLGLQLMTLTE